VHDVRDLRRLECATERAAERGEDVGDGLDLTLEEASCWARKQRRSRCGTKTSVCSNAAEQRPPDPGKFTAERRLPMPPPGGGAGRVSETAPWGG